MINYEILEKNKEKFQGVEIGIQGKEALISNFSNISFTPLIGEILMAYPIVGHNFIISKAMDESTYGVDMEWLSPKDMIDEGLKFYPGIVSTKLGYLPIGSCLKGSGDPYFLKLIEEKLYVVRIRHDRVANDDKIWDDGIEVVCEFNYLISSSDK